jgi:hypothetical protein
MLTWEEALKIANDRAQRTGVRQAVRACVDGPHNCWHYKDARPLGDKEREAAYLVRKVRYG